MRKLILYYISHYFFYIQSGSTYLLRNKAGSRHTRSRVNLQQVYLITCCYDIIYTNNAGTTQNIVDSRSQSLYATREIIRNTGRSNFIYLTVVFSIVVKELIVGNYFRYREHH